MLVALLLFLAALSLGLPLARRLCAGSDDLMLACHALSGGLILMSLLIYLLGITGQLYPGVCLGLLLLPWLGIRPVLPVLGRAALEWRRQIGLLPLMVCVWIGVCGLAPNTHFDVQVYHYAYPELYGQRHSLQFARVNTHEGLIGPAHLLYIPALQLGGEGAANLLNCFYLGILLIACRRLSARPVVWLLLSSPLVIFQSQGGLTDLPTAAYCCLALEALLRKPASGLGAGLWAGQAVAIKWTALSNYLCLIPLCFPRKRLAGALLLGLLLLLPQLSRNLAANGDPFSPLGIWRWAVFGGNQIDPKEPPRIPVPDRLGRFPMNLFHLSLTDRSWQNACNPLILGGILLALAQPRQPIHKVTALAFLGLSLAAPSDLRYAFPTLCWCACVAASWLESSRHKFPRLVPALLVLSCLPGMAVLIALSVQRASLRHGRAVYLASRTSSAAFEFLAREARPDQTVYLLGRRGFRCPIAYVCGDDPPRGVPLPRFDYYLADLREPFLIPALLGELVGRRRGQWVELTSLRVGPLSVLSQSELEEEVRRLGYTLNSNGEIWLERPLGGRPKLKMHGALEARVVFHQDRVVVLQAR